MSEGFFIFSYPTLGRFMGTTTKVCPVTATAEAKQGKPPNTRRHK